MDTVEKRLTDNHIVLKDFVTLLKAVLQDAYQRKIKERFINGCSTATRLVKKFPSLLELFNDSIALLVACVKEETGQLRKHAALLAGKLAEDPRNKDTLRDLPGFEVLASVKDFL